MHFSILPIKVSPSKQLQKTTTNHNAELWSPVPRDTYTKQLLHLQLREHYEDRGRKIVRAKESGSLLSDNVLVMSEATSTKCHCLNMTWTKATAIDMGS